MKYIKRSIVFLVPLIIVGIVGYLAGLRQYIAISDTQEEVETTADRTDEEKLTFGEEIFPPLNMPAEYFDTDKISGGADQLGDTRYRVLYDADGYRSYPTTKISFFGYSNTPEPLPPIKTDKEIHTANPEDDFMGSSKQKSIDQYGDLARRFVGKAGDGWLMHIDNVIDLDNDGKKETMITLTEMGANVIGAKSIIIKDEKIIFSTEAESFSGITPAKNGNGFYITWDDNYKQRDGHSITRFIHNGEKFVPVYEQQIRYVRILQ